MNVYGFPYNRKTVLVKIIVVSNEGYIVNFYNQANELLRTLFIKCTEVCP